MNPKRKVEEMKDCGYIYTEPIGVRNPTHPKESGRSGHMAIFCPKEFDMGDMMRQQCQFFTKQFRDVNFSQS